MENHLEVVHCCQYSSDASAQCSQTLLAKDTSSTGSFAKEKLGEKNYTIRRFLPSFDMS